MEQWKNSTDTELVQAFTLHNDVSAITALFYRYKTLIYGTCLKYLENKEDAEDTTQEIYLHLQKKLALQDIKEFKPWLYVLTKNYCFDLLRKNKRQIVKESEANFMYSDQIFHPDDVIAEVEIKALTDCITSLPKEQADCVNKFYLQNLSYHDIELANGYTWNQIRSYIQNGRRNLKICMDKRK